MSEQFGVKLSIYRGGTSKGLIFSPDDLPSDPELRDKIIVNAFGSPDIRQIDGLGGADSLTSKMAIIGRSARPDADVDYTFGQVSIYEPKIDYSGNCGNISSAVGPYAVDSGLVEAVSPITKVRIYNTNTKKIMEAEVPVVDGKASSCGDTVIDGVPRTGAKIVLNFLDSAGSVTGKLLPSGVPTERLQTSFGLRTVSFVDSGNPVIFINANELGLRGNELPDEITANKAVMDELEEIRGTFAVRMGLSVSWQNAHVVSPGIPKICVVSPARTYTAISKKEVCEENIDITGRMMSMQKPHKAFAVTGAIALGTAAMIPGTIVNEIVSLKKGALGNQQSITIGHPSGTIEVAVEISHNEGEIVINKAALIRTARHLLDGTVYISNKKLSETVLK